MKRFGEAEDPRRRWLIQALAMGAFSGAGIEALAQVLGSAPSKLPAGKSVYRVNGQVLINGQVATTESKVRALSCDRSRPESTDPLLERPGFRRPRFSGKSCTCRPLPGGSATSPTSVSWSPSRLRPHRRPRTDSP